MNAILYLIPITLVLGVLFLAAFRWALQNDQYEDVEGDRYRILQASDDTPLR